MGKKCELCFWESVWSSSEQNPCTSDPFPKDVEATGDIWDARLPRSPRWVPVSSHSSMQQIRLCSNYESGLELGTEVQGWKRNDFILSELTESDMLHGRLGQTKLRDVIEVCMAWNGALDSFLEGKYLSWNLKLSRSKALEERWQRTGTSSRAWLGRKPTARVWYRLSIK